MPKRIKVVLSGQYVSPGDANDGARQTAATLIADLAQVADVEITTAAATDQAGMGSILVSKVVSQ